MKYDRSNLKIGKTTGNFSQCVIDVGCADSGEKGKQLKKHFNSSCIFIDADELSLRKLSTDKDDLIIFAAVSSKSGLGKFNILQEYTHSLNEINLDQIEQFVDGFTGRASKKEDWVTREQIYIPKITLEQIVEDLDINLIHALKIDAQGHDFEVIKGLGKHLSKVKILMCEVQNTSFEVYKNQSNKTELINYLNQYNFELIKKESQTYNQEENLTFKNLLIS